MKTIKKGFITKYARNSTNSGMKTKQKGLHSKVCEFWGDDQKKKEFLLQNLQQTVLAHEYWVNDQYFGDVKFRTAAHSSGIEPVPSLWGGRAPPNNCLCSPFWFTQVTVFATLRNGKTTIVVVKACAPPF